MPLGQSLDPSAPIDPFAGNGIVWLGDDPSEDPGTLKPTYGLNNLDEQLADKIADDPRFNTQLDEAEEQKFQAWKQINAPNDSGYDYDLRGAYKAGLTPSASNGHFDDRFKKPNHPTFSTFSQYAPLAPQYAGGWDGEGDDAKYLPATERMVRDGDMIINPTPLYDQPVIQGGDDGRGYLAHAKDRFLDSSYYNVPLSIAKGAANMSEMVGSLLEAYGDPVIMRTLGEQARAAGIDVNQQIDRALSPAWKKSMEKSWLDASSEGALRDPQAWAAGIASQLPLVAASIVGAEAAAGRLAIAGLDAFKSRTLGYAAANSLGGAGDAAQGAGAAADQAGLSPEQRRRAERIAGYIGAPAGALTGPLFGKIVHGEAGGVLGTVIAGAVEEGVEEGATGIGQEAGKASVGLPFDWHAVGEQASQGFFTGGAMGGAVAKVHGSIAKREAKQQANTDAERAAIESERQRVAAEQAKEQADKAYDASQTAAENADRARTAEGWANAPQSPTESAPIPGAQRPGPAPYGPSPAGPTPPDFVAGQDPSLARPQDRQAQVGDELITVGAAMDDYQQAAQRETNPAKRAKLVSDFQAQKRRMASLQAEWAQGAQQQGFEPVGPPVDPHELWPTTQSSPEPNLDTTRAYAQAVDTLHTLQQQIAQTRDPVTRSQLVDQFRAVNQQVISLRDQTSAEQPSASGPPDTAPEGAPPSGAPAALPAPEARLALPAPPLLLSAPDTQDLGLSPTGPPATQTGKGKFSAGTTPSAVMTEAAQAAARAAPDRYAAQVVDLQGQLDRLKTKLGQDAAKPGARPAGATRAKLVGEYRKLVAQHREATRLLADATATRDRLIGASAQDQPGLSGLPQTGGQTEVDYQSLTSQLDAKMRPVAEDATPAATSLPERSPLETQAATATVEPLPPPLLAEVQARVKRSQAAKAGHATKAAARQQAVQDASQLDETEAAQHPASPAYDPSVIQQGPEVPAPELPQPAPLQAFPTAATPALSMGAELQAIRDRFPTESRPEVSPSVGQGAPPAAEQGSGGTTPAPQASPAPSGSQAEQSVGMEAGLSQPGVPATIVPPSKVEKARRRNPVSQPELVDIAAGLNPAMHEASTQNGEITADEPLPDPSNPAFKVPEANDPVLGVPAMGKAMAGEPTSHSATAARAVLERVLADGPKNLNEVMGHLLANLQLDPQSVTGKLAEKLLSAFPATTKKPTSVMVEKRALTHNFQGLYDPRSDTISLDLDQALDPLQAFLHEVVHAALITKSRTNPDFQRRLRNLALDAQKRWRDLGFRPDPDEERAFDNHEEFIAHALTNTAFQDRLDKLYETGATERDPSMWQTIKGRILIALGMNTASAERRLTDQLLEFMPDGDFLQEAENRAQVLAELDRLGLGAANAMMSTFAGLMRPTTPQPANGPVVPRGRVLTKLLHVYTGDMIINSWGKFGKSFLNTTTGQIESLSNTVERFGRLIDQKAGYAMREQARGSKIVDVFKNAMADAVGDQLGANMERARMYQLDPSLPLNHVDNLAGAARPGSARAYAELQAMWAKLSPAEQDTFRLVRDEGEAVRYRHINNMMVHRVRAMVSAQAADQLSAFINSRPVVWSPTGQAYHIPIGHAPVLTRGEIDAQVTALMPKGTYSDQQRKNVSEGLKEVHTLIKASPGPFFPLRRYGKYFVALKSEKQSRVMTPAELDDMVAEDRENGTGTLMVDSQRPLGGGGRVMVEWHHEGVTSHDTEAEAEAAHADADAAWQAQAKLDGRKPVHATFGNALLQRENTYEALGLKQNSIDSLRRDLVTSLGGGTGVGQMASDVVLDWFLDKLPSTSIKKSNMKARLVKGASTDMLRAFSDYVLSNSYTQAQMAFGGQINQILTNDLRDDVDKMSRNGAGRQANDLQALGNAFKDRQTAFMDTTAKGRNADGIVAMWQGAPQVAAGWLLTGWSSMLTNMAQVPQMSLPWLGARYGFAASTAALGKAYSDILPPLVRTTGAEYKRAAFENIRSGRLTKAIRRDHPTPSIRDPKLSMIDRIADQLKADPDEADLIHKLAELGKADYGLVADLHATGSSRKRPGWLPDAARYVTMPLVYLTEAAFIGPQAAETLNRVVTGLAAFRLERAKMQLTGKPLLPAVYDQLVIRTAKAVNDTQFNYGRENKAPLMQQESLRAALTFKNFTFHTWYTIGHNFLQSMHAETAEERAIARKFLGGYAVTTMAVAGLAGFTSMEAVYLAAVALMGLLGSDDDDPETALRREMADAPNWLTNTVTRGVPYALGVDTSQRLGIGSMVPLQEIMRTLHDPGAGKEAWMAQLGSAWLGAPGSIASDSMQAVGHFANGEFTKGLQEASPKAFGLNDLVRAWNLAHYGVRDSKDTTILPPEQVTTAEKIIRAVGFNPSRIAEIQAKRAASAAHEKPIQYERADIIEDYAKAVLAHQDPSPVIDRAIKFSQKYPGDRITKAGLLASIKARQKRILQVQQHGTAVRGKGATLRANEYDDLYDSAELPPRAPAQQLGGKQGGGVMDDPSMPGIAANANMLQAFGLKIDRSKRSSNLVDQQEITAKIGQFNTMAQIEDSLRALRPDLPKETIDYNLKRLRDASPDEATAVDIGKDMVLNTLSHVTFGKEDYSEMNRPPGMTLGAKLLPKDPAEPEPDPRLAMASRMPVPKSKPRPQARSER